MEETKQFNKKVYVETMGCQMNKSDTERILGMLSHFGYEETQDPKSADLLIVNTCSIRQLSADKAYSAVGVWGKWKNEERKKELLERETLDEEEFEEIMKKDRLRL